MSRIISVSLVLVVLFGVLGVSPSLAENPESINISATLLDCGNSAINSFTVSPSTNVDQGTWLTVSGSGNCGTSRILVNGIHKAEIGSPVITTTIKTEEFPAGNLTIVYQLKDDNDGNWNNATSRTINVSVRAVSNPTLNTAGLDIDLFCVLLGYDRGRFLNPNDAFTARCIDGNVEANIDMYEVCEFLYSGDLPYPGLEDRHDPQSWSCNSTPAEVNTWSDTPANDDSGSGSSGGNGNNNNSGGTGNTGSGGTNSGGNNNSNNGGNDGGGSSGSGAAITYTNARVGDTVVVVNSPSNNALLCKSSASRGTDNVIKRITNGDTMTITGGPWYDNGLYFVSVTGACNGYVATGVSGERWIQRSGSSTSNNNGGGGSNNNNGNSGGGNSNNNSCSMTSPVSSGDTGQITEGPPNRLRSGAGTNHSQIGTIPGGATFAVTGSSRCSGGITWIPVRYNGQNGWTAVGDGGVYWVVKVNGVNDTGPSGGGSQFISNTYNRSCAEHRGDGCYNGSPPWHADVIYVNGIINTIETNEEKRSYIASSFYSGQNVMGLFNDGLSGNLGSTSPTTSLATRNLKNYLIDYGCDVTLIGHSQGGAVIADAIEDLQPGCLRQLRIRTFGSVANDWPNEVNDIYHCVFRDDPVPKIGGAGSIRNRIVIVQDPDGPPYDTVNHALDGYLYYARAQCHLPS